jgi:peptidoglycan/LPS O-acetylase OafA/YrhL
VHDFLIKTLTRLYEAMFGRIGSIEEALVASLFGFALTVPVAWVSYKLIESPFLRFRVRYLAPRTTAGTPA